MTSHFLFFLLLSLLSFICVSSLSPTSTSSAPFFLLPDSESSVSKFALDSVRTTVSIDGVIAQVALTQVYTNEGSRPIDEALYVFPASTEASVYAMHMLINDKRLVIGQIYENTVAQDKYDEAREEGKTVSLLELQRSERGCLFSFSFFPLKRPNIFTMKVANILPGDRIEVHNFYAEVLVPTESVYHFILPQSVGPRFNGEITDDNFDQGTPAFVPLELDLKLNAGMPLRDFGCPSHSVVTTEISQQEIFVELNLPLGHDQTQDFVYEYRLAGAEITTGLLVYHSNPLPFDTPIDFNLPIFLDENGERLMMRDPKDKGESLSSIKYFSHFIVGENYFLAVLQPPSPLEIELEPLPREYIFVVDV